MPPVSVDEELERLHRELERLRGEAERLRIELAQRPGAAKELSEATRTGIAARDLLASLADALAFAGQGGVLRLTTTTTDILKLVSLCEDDAARAGPLVDAESRWYANVIRRSLL